MGLKRTVKRKNNQPHTKMGDWGFKGVLSRLDRAIEIVAQRKSAKKEC
jgi:hypothetical protein